MIAKWPDWDVCEDRARNDYFDPLVVTVPDDAPGKCLLQAIALRLLAASTSVIASPSVRNTSTLSLAATVAFLALYRGPAASTGLVSMELVGMPIQAARIAASFL
jgi:hypothetical protein